MGHTARGRRSKLVGWLMAAALCCVVVLALSYASSRERSYVLDLAGLAQGHELLMSCGDGSELPSSEPLWCSDPSNPQCIPAAPSAPHTELWHGELTAVALPTSLALPRSFAVFLGWRRPLPESTPDLRQRDPLERPPRA